MEASFLISPGELTVDFLEGIKKTFSGKSKIRIQVEEEMDETEFVEKYQGDSIRRAQQQHKEGKTIVFQNTDELKKWLEKDTGITI